MAGVMKNSLSKYLSKLSALMSFLAALLFKSGSGGRTAVKKNILAIVNPNSGQFKKLLLWSLDNYKEDSMRQKWAMYLKW